MVASQLRGTESWTREPTQTGTHLVVEIAHDFLPRKLVLQQDPFTIQVPKEAEFGENHGAVASCERVRSCLFALLQGLRNS